MRYGGYERRGVYFLSEKLCVSSTVPATQERGHIPRPPYSHMVKAKTFLYFGIKNQWSSLDIVHGDRTSYLYRLTVCRDCCTYARIWTSQLTSIGSLSFLWFPFRDIDQYFDSSPNCAITESIYGFVLSDFSILSVVPSRYVFVRFSL